MKDSKLRIVVTGLVASYPLGGVFWDYMQYVAGFRRLGHDVLYLEDTGQWSYDPEARTFIESGEKGAAFLARHLAALDPELARRWFFRDGAGVTHGLPWPEVVRFCRSADLFVHLSASCWMKDEYREAKVVAFVDTDPMYTQAHVPAYLAGGGSVAERGKVEGLRDDHDVHFTFAENIGRPDCLVPDAVFDWIPTRQPILLDCFRAARQAVPARRRVFTTVASWTTKEGGPVVGGVQYFGKGVEFERFMGLPPRVDIPLELAISGGAPLDRMRREGWTTVDGAAVSRDPWSYRDYLASAYGEWSVAKHAYVASRSGWFSCRTACYLALGVPAVVQDTGFSRIYPCGEGLLAFTSLDEASAAIEDVARDPERHSRAAAAIAEEYFNSDQVLDDFVQKAMAGAGTRGARHAGTLPPPGNPTMLGVNEPASAPC